jgi:uncharacterized protein (DUF488 family)
MTTLYTVGHSRHSADRFAELLLAQQIALLADVRSHPVSRWAPQFGKDALPRMLAAHSLDYVFLGRELGGRPAGAELYGPDGRLDYARRAGAPDFQAGIERLAELARARRTAILCAEEDPARCHRRLLVAPALQRLGFDIVHLRGDGRLEPDLPTPSAPPQLALFE